MTLHLPGFTFYGEAELMLHTPTCSRKTCANVFYRVISLFFRRLLFFSQAATDGFG